MTSPQPWWRSAVVYQIYPRSFADASGDGVGDLPGITAKLDHLAWLGVDALWLSPFYPSPMADFGYDVADECDVDPLFGTLDDFDALVAAAHERGLRVVIDHVPNHTSDQHPWFVESRADADGPKRDWYWWRDGRDGGPAGEQPPTNWRATFTGEHRWERDADGQLRPTFASPPPVTADSSTWTRDDHSGQWYLHSFLPEQPDLNWRNPEVRAAMLDVLRFWTDRGVDGFRIDAIRCVGKPEVLADLPPELASVPQAEFTDTAFVDDVVRSMRRTVQEAGAAAGRDLMLIGEMHAAAPDAIARHVADDLLTQAFAFPLMFEPWDRDAWARQIAAVVALSDERGDAHLSWVLSNHDEPRVAERYGSEARARAALLAVLTLPGAAFLYTGDELGLRDAVVPPSQRVDPGGRDGCRAPLPWTPDALHGWPTDPWLPFPADVEGHDVESQRADPTSTLHLCRAVLSARRSTPALHAGGFAWLAVDAPVLGWRRTDPAAFAGTASTGDRAVVVNHRPEPITVTGADAAALEGWEIVVSTVRPEGATFDGTLAADEAVVLRPPP